MRILTLLTALTICASAFGQAFSIFDPAMQAETVASAAPTYLVSEDCEGAGTPSGWVTAGAGTKNWDYSPALIGSQCLFLDFTAQSAYVYTNVPAGDVYEWFSLCVISNVSGSGPILVSVMNGGTPLGYIVASDVSLTSLSVGGGNAYLGGYTPGVPFHLWIRYEVPGIIRACISTTETKPAWISVTNGTATAQITRLSAGSLYNRTGTFMFDKIRISTTEIGSNPP